MVQPVIPPEGQYYPHRERPFAILIEKLATKFWNRFIEPSSIGLLPKEYNKNIHGPYVPYRYYGKPDTPFKDVKLAELPAWLRRRKMRPFAIVQAISRTSHYWADRFSNVRFPNAAWLWQLCFIYSAVMYACRHTSLHNIHTKARYH